MTKTSEMSREAFGIAVAERTSELRNKALAASVPKEQLEEIVTSVYGQTQDLSLVTAVNRIKNAFANKIEAASATLLVGVLVGSRDFVGKKAPIKYMLVKKDKKHVEVSNFGTKAQYQGEKIEIPVPAAVEIRAVHDPEYDSWNLKEIVSYQTIPKDALIKVLKSVAIPVKSITKDMAYEKGKSSGKPVVISGKMNYFRTEVVFKHREDFDDGKKAEIDHALPVMMPREMAMNSSDVLPCFQFSLTGKGHGANSPRCHFQQMRYGTPNVMVEDLIPIASRAVTKCANNPEDQATYLNEWLADMDVIVVGAVNRFSATYTEDKVERNYIDIVASCVVDIPEPLEEGGQKQIAPPAKSTPHITTQTPPIVTAPAKPKVESPPVTQVEAPAEEESEEDKAVRLAEEAAALAKQKAAAAKAAKAAAAAAAKKPEAATAAAPAAGGESNIIGIAKAIKLFCRASGTTPEQIDIETLKTKALDMIEIDGQMPPDAVILEALDYLKATSAALGK